MLQVDDYILKRLKRLIHKRKVGVDEDLLLLHLLRKETVPDEQRHGKIKPAAKQTKELLNLENPPTCIIYPDDTALIGGRNVIIEMGLRIPKDISVAGYDGTRMSQLLHPKLTTIKQDTEEIGREAAKRLIGSIEKPKTTLLERVVIEGILIPGQSVGKIPEQK